MFSWFVAQRLFKQGGGAGRASRLADSIATAGVAIGLVVMLLSVSIAVGFKHEVQEKVLGFGSHIRVMNYQSLGSEQYSPIVIDDTIKAKLESLPACASVARFCMKPAMLKTDANFRGIAIQGIGSDYDISFLRKHLISGEMPQFTDSVASKQIVLSKSVAREMQVEVGDAVYAYFFEEDVRARKFTVAGIYCTNLTDFDNNFVYTDITTIHTLLGWDPDQYSGAEIRLNDFKRLNEAMAAAIQTVNHKQDAYGCYYSTVSVKEEHPQIFAWLQLLDLDVLVILILMICVSVFTAISGLLIIILERTNFIGIMKALGARNGQVRSLFLAYAFFIILRGVVVGNVVAFALIYMQKLTGVVSLDPEVYYVEAVPVMVDWLSVAVIDAVTLLVCYLSMLIPSLVISHIYPARSIRFE